MFGQQLDVLPQLQVTPGRRVFLVLLSSLHAGAVGREETNRILEAVLGVHHIFRGGTDAANEERA